MRCDFAPTGEPAEWRCTRPECGRVVRRVKQLPIVATCNAVDQDEPPPHMIRRIFNFAEAAIKQVPLVAGAVLTGDWAKAFRSEARIVEIAAICRKCPLFNRRLEVCTHPDCGCNIDMQRSVYISKLAYRSASCPDDPPRWR